MAVTPIYAGILAVLFFALSMRVIAVRSRVSLGDGGDPTVLRRMRGHANFAEYVPFILLMMAFLELSHFSTYFLHAAGIVLVVARLLHGYALSFTEKFFLGRFGGTLLTLVLLLVCGTACLYQGLRASAIL